MKLSLTQRERTARIRSLPATARGPPWQSGAFPWPIHKAAPRRDVVIAPGRP